ncbi:MAG TPA: hypothetical protein VFI46_00770 [Jiangellaceae bacterium]|nr:hypothetical protein [Jiangellaceae bacterium]
MAAGHGVGATSYTLVAPKRLARRVLETDVFFVPGRLNEPMRRGGPMRPAVDIGVGPRR